MKLLLDQNLSHRLLPAVARVFPGSKHVFDIGLSDATDEQIWNHARTRGYAIISKDSDFMHRSIVRGHPPKVIQLQIGNRSTDEIATTITSQKTVIRQFLKNRNESLLILK